MLAPEILTHEKVTNTVLHYKAVSAEGWPFYECRTGGLPAMPRAVMRARSREKLKRE